jgi:hypothetical protein
MRITAELAEYQTPKAHDPFPWLVAVKKVSAPMMRKHVFQQSDADQPSILLLSNGKLKVPRFKCPADDKLGSLAKPMAQIGRSSAWLDNPCLFSETS